MKKNSKALSSMNEQEKKFNTERSSLPEKAVEEALNLGFEVTVVKKEREYATGEALHYHFECYGESTTVEDLNFDCEEWQYQNVMESFQKVKDSRAEAKRKEELRKTAKAKLTAEEREALGLR